MNGYANTCTTSPYFRDWHFTQIKIARQFPSFCDIHAIFVCIHAPKENKNFYYLICYPSNCIPCVYPTNRIYPYGYIMGAKQAVVFPPALPANAAGQWRWCLLCLR